MKKGKMINEDRREETEKEWKEMDEKREKDRKEMIDEKRKDRKDR